MNDVVISFLCVHFRYTRFLYKNQYIWTGASIVLNSNANCDLIKWDTYYMLEIITNDPATINKTHFLNPSISQRDLGPKIEARCSYITVLIF